MRVLRSLSLVILLGAPLGACPGNVDRPLADGMYQARRAPGAAGAPGPAPTTAPLPTAAASKVPDGKPAEGTISELQNGDLACYVILKDPQGREHSLMGEFELCEKPERFLKKRVRLTYKAGSVNDCESAEPCGRSKKVQLVHRLEVVK